MVPVLFLALINSLPAAAAAPPANLQIPWDWSGVIGTGQSLAVGQGGRPVASTTQPYNNLKLSTAHLPWPIDPLDPAITIVPLIEPIGRLSTGYPSAWPDNITGETPHAAMANELTALVRAEFNRDFLGVHTEVGENGQGIRYLKKNAIQSGVNGRSYDAAIIETTAITRLAKAAGKSYGVAAIVVTHGENDAGNANYESELRQLCQDYNADLPAVTGQTQKVLMILSQQNAVKDRSASTLAQWKIGVDFPADIVCSGPKYQYPSGEGVHLTTEGYRQLGEKYAQVYFQRLILAKDWQPLEPTGADRRGPVITVHFHVPVLPLAWDAAFQPPHQSIAEWKLGKGFEVSTAGGQRVAIESAEIAGDAVVITCAADPGASAHVGYAMIGEKVRMKAPFPGTFRWGQLRDSDPFTGAITGKPQPNYAMAFELEVP